MTSSKYKIQISTTTWENLLNRIKEQKQEIEKLQKIVAFYEDQADDFNKIGK